MLNVYVPFLAPITHLKLWADLSLLTSCNQARSRVLSASGLLRCAVSRALMLTGRSSRRELVACTQVDQCDIASVGRVWKKGFLGKRGLFRKVQFLETLENLEIVEILENSQTMENKGEADRFLEIVENLDI